MLGSQGTADHQGYLLLHLPSPGCLTNKELKKTLRKIIERFQVSSATFLFLCRILLAASQVYFVEQANYGLQ